MFPSKVSGLKSQSNISYFAHEHILLFSHTYHRSFTSGHNRFLGRLAQALLIRARILLTVLPDTNKGVRGKNNEIKRSFTISSEVIFYNPQNEMFRLLGTKRSFSQNETFFFSHP